MTGERHGDDHHSALVAQFLSVMPTCTEESATFYLEANNWDLQCAMSNFYEDREEGSEQGTEGLVPSKLAATSSGALGGNLGPFVSGTGVGSFTGGDGPRPEEGGEGARYGSGTRASVPARENSSNSRAQGGVMTLRDLGNDRGDGNEGEGQNMFAGGKQSAMAVQNPDHSGGGNLVEDIIKKAAQAGVEPPSDDETTPQRAFVGAGYRLGSESSPSQVVTPSGQPLSQSLPAVSRVLTFWRNGFSVDDGPLYAYDDPANAETLEAINSGQAPMHVLGVRPGQPVNVKVAKRMDEDYVAPKVALKPFSGGGQRLGGVESGEVSRMGEPPQRLASSLSTSLQCHNSPPELKLDPSRPVASLQIRLADGTRMVSKFNVTHTVADVRNFINASRLGEASRRYVLQTTFPTKDLTDEKQTLKDAGLLNAVIVQRLI